MPSDGATHPLPTPPAAGLVQLLDLLDLEPIEADLFRGQNPAGSGRLFGGQVMAQALVAAGRTVAGDRQAHSLHGYFLRPGDPSRPTLFSVERTRDGRSFTTRNVVAIQHGRAIFSMTASFQQAEDGFDHATAPPNVATPEQLAWPRQMRREAFSAIQVEYREVEAGIAAGAAATPLPPRQHVWFRTNGAVPVDPLLARALLTYQSDAYLLSTSRLPHLGQWTRRTLQRASLDHAVWFHREPVVDDWLLYALDSPSAAGARGYNRGSLYRRDGTLVASTMQECLMRNRPDARAQPTAARV